MAILTASSESRSEKTDRAWRVMLVVGIALLVMGITDLSLLLVPGRFGDLEWEFATVSAMLNNLPVPVMGAGLILMSGLARDEPVPVTTALVWAVIMTIVLLGSSILYLLNAPLAMRAVTEAVPRTALKAALLKGSVAIVTYLVLHITIAIQAARFLRGK